MSVREVNVHEAFELLEDDAFLLDVRENSEYDLGHAPMATLIPLAELPDHLDDLPKTRLIICVCHSGGRSLRAATFLQEQGFTVANMTGGMSAWHKEDLPLESENGDATVD